MSVVDPRVYLAYLVNMPRSELHAIEDAVKRLSELLGQPPLRVNLDPAGGDLGVDARVEFPNRLVLLLCKWASDVAAVAGGVRALAPVVDDALPLLVVPYMGDAGRRVCEEAGVSWLDLSGNAHVVAPGLRVVIEGKPNLFKRAGRPSTAFSPKSARIARWLLTHPRQPASQQEIADATEMDRGFTSRIVRRLIDDELVERTDDGLVVASRPDLLLEAWAERYDWNKHRVVKGVVAARSGTELISKLAEGLSAAGVEHAFTGLAAAWQYDHFAAFRLTSAYLPSGLPSGLLASLGVHEGERGANTWLVVPNDEGVMYGAADVGGIPCVHPVQVWLDLAAHPERAREAREHLRSEHMRWTDA
jgi:hypothetical protein